jgi:hypothetical protein
MTATDPTLPELARKTLPELVRKLAMIEAALPPGWRVLGRLTTDATWPVEVSLHGIGSRVERFPAKSWSEAFEQALAATVELAEPSREQVRSLALHLVDVAHREGWPGFLTSSAVHLRHYPAGCTQAGMRMALRMFVEITGRALALHGPDYHLSADPADFTARPAAVTGVSFGDFGGEPGD